MAVLLSKKSKVPLYHQLKGFISEQIDSGQWRPGAQVPSERELCEQFHISRITVRQALTELSVEGRLIREHGRGTFVAPPRIHQTLTRLTGFSQDMQARGQRPGAQVLQLEPARASPLTARALRLKPGDSTVMLRRLRLANDEPLAVETAHLPDWRCHSLLDGVAPDQSLYQILAEDFDIIAARAEQQLKAVPCPGPEARLLGVPRNSPVMQIYRTTFDRDDAPFEWVESYYRGDKYVFQAELTHP